MPCGGDSIIASFMRRRLVSFCVAACCVAVAACSRAADDAPPVAAPSVTLNMTEAGIGAPIEMSYRFAVEPGAPAISGDYLVFVHFLDKDGELLWTDDHEAAPPVRQWKAGDNIQYNRTVFVPKVPYEGEVNVDVGLYSPKSGDRLPMRGEAVGMRSYRVGKFTIRQQGAGVFVVFKDGWHATEVGDPGSGLEWQWSKKEGVVTFRNPRRDVELFLDVDQPVTALPQPQHVDVHIGPQVVDSFDLRPGDRVLRRVAITSAQLGAADTVEMGVTVDRTFVPAALPTLKSSDSRELGIRVFRAYVQPK